MTEYKTQRLIVKTNRNLINLKLKDIAKQIYYNLDISQNDLITGESRALTL